MAKSKHCYGYFMLYCSRIRWQVRFQCRQIATLIFEMLVIFEFVINDDQCWMRQAIPLLLFFPTREEKHINNFNRRYSKCWTLVDAKSFPAPLVQLFKMIYGKLKRKGSWHNGNYRISNSKIIQNWFEKKEWKVHITSLRKIGIFYASNMTNLYLNQCSLIHVNMLVCNYCIYCGEIIYFV